MPLFPQYAAREAETVAQAGRKYAITISTNMAGRGTDIILGGNPKVSQLAWWFILYFVNCRHNCTLAIWVLTVIKCVLAYSHAFLFVISLLGASFDIKGIDFLLGVVIYTDACKENYRGQIASASDTRGP